MFRKYRGTVSAVNITKKETYFSSHAQPSFIAALEATQRCTYATQKRLVSHCMTCWCLLTNANDMTQLCGAECNFSAEIEGKCFCLLCIKMNTL